MTGTSKTTAQVHPFLFTHTLLASAVKTGHANLVFGTASGLLFDSENKITGVTASKFSGSREDAVALCRERGYEPRVLEADETIKCDYLVICMGPWSGTVNDWLPAEVTMPRIDGLVDQSNFADPFVPADCFLFYSTDRIQAHSIVMRTEKPIPAQCRESISPILSFRPSNLLSCQSS
jgi:hypothetical protein